MAENKSLICVNCPMGCMLVATVEDGGVTSVTGNQCKRGIAYAEAECVNPTRVVTSTVPVRGGEVGVLPVKTRTAIPKALIMACMDGLRGVEMRAPVGVGDVVVADIAGSGVDMVATRAVAACGDFLKTP